MWDTSVNPLSLLRDIWFNRSCLAATDEDNEHSTDLSFPRNVPVSALAPVDVYSQFWC